MDQLTDDMIIQTSNVRVTKLGDMFLLVMAKSQSYLTSETMFSHYKINRPTYEILKFCEKSRTIKEIKDQFSNFEEEALLKILEKMIDFGVIKVLTRKVNRPQSSIDSFPPFVDWTITKYCTAFCKHCMLSASPFAKKPSLTDRKMMRIARKLFDFGTLHITFLGGESTAVENFFNIVEYCYERHFSMEIDTNGWGINEKIVKNLREMRDRIFINISLDSHISEVHDSFRGLRGLFKRAVRAIKLLNEHQIRFKVNTVLLNENIETLRDMFDFLRGLNVKHWNISHVLPMGRALKDYWERFPSPDELVQAFYELYLLTSKADMLIDFPLNPNNFMNLRPHEWICEHDGLRRSIGIDDVGNLYLCPRIEETFLGNIWEMRSSRQLLKKSMENWMWNTTVNDLPLCKNCELKKICGGGCRAIAKNLDNSVKGCDILTKKLIESFMNNMLQKIPQKSQRNFLRLLEPVDS